MKSPMLSPMRSPMRSAMKSPSFGDSSFGRRFVFGEDFFDYLYFSAPLFIHKHSIGPKNSYVAITNHAAHSLRLACPAELPTNLTTILTIPLLLPHTIVVGRTLQRVHQKERHHHHHHHPSHDRRDDRRHGEKTLSN